MAAQAKFLGSTVPSTPEHRGRSVSGWLGILLELLVLGATVVMAILGFAVTPWWLIGAGLAALVFLVCFNGFFVLQPNQTEVLVFFGKYNGTIRRDGFHFVKPLNTKRRLSTRIHNFSTEALKVNEAGGNPIEIGAVVVWRVVDTARATFDVQDYSEFVHVQSETAVRSMASRYPYDEPEKPGGQTLRGSTDEVSADLKDELQSRLDVAGVHVLEARLTHLAYSPEIAGAMLQRQQAAAVVAARRRIVEGAVRMVEDALRSLSDLKIVNLKQDQRADLVSNLMVVLTSDRGAQPVVNTGR